MTGQLITATGLHLSVDGICAAALMQASHDATSDEITLCFILYNILAFGMQVICGYVLDRRPRLCRTVLLLSGALLLAGTCPVGLAGQAVLLGTGNCLFHVACGVFVLRTFRGFREPGIFVSGGAIGLGLGVGEYVPVTWFALLTPVLLCLFVTRMREPVPSGQTEEPWIRETDGPSGSRPLLMASMAALLLLCVVIRGFGSGPVTAAGLLILPCTHALGKMLGGIVCDRIGLYRTIALIFLTGVLALQWNALSAYLVLVLCFSMTMPLTLRLLHRCFPEYPGCMFGAAAACLLPGFLFSSSFLPDVHCMLVLQFLILFLTGTVLYADRRRLSREPQDQPDQPDQQDQ